MFNDEVKENYTEGYIKGQRDKRLARGRYYTAESTNDYYIDGYDDGFDGAEFDPRMRV